MPTKHLKTMEFFQWHWWAALALLLFIAEIFGPGFWLASLGIGCIGGSLAAAFGFGPEIQLVAFSLIAVLGFLGIRPVLMKRMWTGSNIRTNVDALVGQLGRVSQEFEPGLRLGRVAVGGDDWRAECTTDRVLLIGDIVEVVRVESNTVVVKPVDAA